MSKKIMIAVVVLSVCILGVSGWYVSYTLLGNTDTSGKIANNASGKVTTNTDAAAGSNNPNSDSPTDPEQSAPAKLVATGKELPEVVNPPEKTLAMVELKNVPEKGYQIKATFRLYGTAMGGQAFVLAVSEASSDVKDPAFEKVVKRLSGSNMIVDSTPESSKVIAQGGEYTGTITTVSQGDTTYGFRLESAAKVSK